MNVEMQDECVVIIWGFKLQGRLRPAITLKLDF